MKFEKHKFTCVQFFDHVNTAQLTKRFWVFERLLFPEDHMDNAYEVHPKPNLKFQNQHIRGIF